MSVKQSIYKGVFWKATFYSSVFLLNICIARYFEASVSGLIFYITNLYSLVLLLLSFSIESGMTFFLSRQEIPASRLSAIAFTWTALAAIIVAAGLLFYRFPPHLKIVGNMPLTAFLFFSGMLLITFFSALLAGKKDFKTAFIIQSTGNAALILFLAADKYLGFSFFKGNSFIYWYFVLFFVEGLAVAVLFIFRYTDKILAGRSLAPDVKKLVGYSSVVFLSNVIYFLLYRIDYWFVEYYCDDKSLGNYVQVSKIGQLLITIPSTVSMVIFPYIAEKGKGGFLPELQLLSRVMLASFSIICLLAVLTGYWLFPFLLGHTFEQMYVPFLLLIPGILSLVSLYPYTFYYAGINMAKRNVTGSLVGLIIVVIADLLLIPRFGIKGAALASSIGYLCFQGYIMFWFKKDFHISLRQSFLLHSSDLARVLTLSNKRS